MDEETVIRVMWVVVAIFYGAMAYHCGYVKGMTFRAALAALDAGEGVK